MDEIKFRAFDFTTNEMDSWEDILYEYENARIAFTERYMLVPMQYTGIKDDGGNEIYDGDIVRVWEQSINGGIFTHICKVYQAENGTWMMEGHPEHNKSYRTKLELYSHRKKVDVIGNCFENIDLAEATK